MLIILGDIFVSTVGNISSKYELDISPSGFTLAIWSLIYFWIAISIGFCKFYILYNNLYNSEIKLRPLNPMVNNHWLYVTDLFSLFNGSDLGKLYLCPEVISPWYSFFFIVNLCLNTAWIFVWDREQLVGASIVLFSIVLTNIISLGILAKNIAYDGHQLRKDKPKIYW